MREIDQGGVAQSMSLRDWMAGMALQGMAAEYLKGTSTDYRKPENWLMQAADSCDYDPENLVAKAAYQLADAMLEERGAP